MGLPVARARLACALLVLALGPSRAGGQVVISEVMFDPSGSEFYDEFIEVQNLGPDPVDLSGWRVGDGEETDEILARRGDPILPGGAFGLILDSGYFEHSTRYDPLPEEAVILMVGDATLGKGGLSNSRPERVVLIAAEGDTVAAVAYRVGNVPGHSDEKIQPGGGDAPDNWADSKWDGGTPGRVNSVSPKQDDLALSVAPAMPIVVGPGDEGGVTLTVTNLGRRPATGFRVEVSGETVWEQGAEVLPGDSLAVVYPLRGPASGRLSLTAAVIFAADQDTSNNRVSVEVVFGARLRQAVVNEMMYAPLPGDPEWVEIHNRSEEDLDLFGWRIQDGRPSSAAVFQEGSARLAAGGFAVVCEDTARFRASHPWAARAPTTAPARWPRLNDGGDAVVIKDAAGSVVDSAVYRGGLASPGRSLERIDPDGASEDPDNWLPATEARGSTPGGPNSVLFRDAAGGVELAASPNPFRQRAEIASHLPVSRAVVNLWVFDSAGRRVRTLLNGESGGSRRSVDWDGSGEAGERLKPGIYVLYLEAAGPDGQVYRTRTPLVLAKGL